MDSASDSSLSPAYSNCHRVHSRCVVLQLNALRCNPETESELQKTVMPTCITARNCATGSQASSATGMDNDTPPSSISSESAAHGEIVDLRTPAEKCSSCTYQTWISVRMEISFCLNCRLLRAFCSYPRSMFSCVRVPNRSQVTWRAEFSEPSQGIIRLRRYC